MSIVTSVQLKSVQSSQPTAHRSDPSAKTRALLPVERYVWPVKLEWSEKTRLVPAVNVPTVTVVATCAASLMSAWLVGWARPRSSIERAAIDLIVWTTMVPARGSAMGAPTLSTDIGRPPPGPGAMVLEGPGVGLGSPADTPGPLATRTTIAIALAHRARDLLVLCIARLPRRDGYRSAQPTQ